MRILRISSSLDPALGYAWNNGYGSVIHTYGSVLVASSLGMDR
jgi:hypothetical protein